MIGDVDARGVRADVLRSIGKIVPAVTYRRTCQDGSWRYAFIGGCVSDFFGCDTSEVFSTRDGFNLTFIHSEDRARIVDAYAAAVANGGGVHESECRIVSRTGRMRRLRTFIDIETSGGREIASVGMMFDIGYLDAEAERLRRLADYDALTGLSNRTHFIAAIGDAVERHQHVDRPFAIVVFDLDDFHEINEAYGHRTADEIAPGAILGRLGADRFGLLTDAAQGTDAVSVADEIARCFERPFEIGKQLMWISVSGGIAFGTDATRDAAELLAQADGALERASEAGGGIFKVFSAESGGELLKRLVLKEHLHTAADQGQFALHYQPKVEARSGRVIGAEALIRWNHPELGFQSPADFIPIAERTGLIVPIGQWVIREACRQSQRWRRAGMAGVPIAVNVSSVQFARSQVLQTLREALVEFDVPPGGLEIEITEGTLADCSDGLITELVAIRALGVGIALDDFGTGFSSLAYLHRLPLSLLKVDKTFVQGALKNERDAAIVRSVVHLANQLDLRTVAEGVETLEQLTFVRDSGCDEVQGYFFSPPMRPDDFAWYVEQNEGLADDELGIAI
ncbi:MAG: GGDEF and EAL domain-containing protein [Candidatus Eremiobacteraeota bacterium]|nr:GGDEF and EAL domain-containing protein [Candidatus Eremiobacteraeota bacterium]